MITFDKNNLYYDNYNAFFYKKGNDLYKVFKNYVSERLETQIMINNYISKEVDKHIILPTELLYNEKKWLVGYKMNYVDGLNLEKMIYKNNLTDEDKIFIINELFSLLEEIHDYLIVGDVRNSNIMIGKDGNAYLIDFDYAVRNDSSAVPCCRYHINYQDEYLNDQNEDIIKMYISALSILYNYNIEDIFSKHSDIKYLENYIPLSGYFNEYYHYMVDMVTHHKKINNYFKLPLDENIMKDINTGKSRIRMP